MEVVINVIKSGNEVITTLKSYLKSVYRYLCSIDV